MRKAHDNPFRVERVLRIRYEPMDTTWSALMDRLDSLRYRAAIVGPHGSGKTTLLEDLADRLRDRGVATRMFTQRANERRGSATEIRRHFQTVDGRTVMLIDGHDHLSLRASWQVRRLARRSAGLIVTSHRRTTLPTLIRTRTTPALLRRMVAQLLHHEGPVPPCDTDALWRRHRGNLRDALREMYDRAAQSV